jgi:hypothetical protein
MILKAVILFDCQNFSCFMQFSGSKDEENITQRNMGGKYKMEEYVGSTQSFKKCTKPANKNYQKKKSVQYLN